MQAQPLAEPPILFDLSLWTGSGCAALVHAFVASLSVILVSELGDKTFIITAIMAMKNSRSLVFFASALALLTMTVLSVGMGVAVTVVPKVYTHNASIVLFVCFGLKMLKEAYDIKEDAEESEFDEVKRSLEANEQDLSDEAASAAGAEPEVLDKTKEEQIIEAEEAVQSPQWNLKSYASDMFGKLRMAPLFIKIYTMIFVAEWGDRSQISTIILAAREDVAGVFLGSFIGHLTCTGAAVVGGRFVAEMISVRTMTFLGGLIFLSFAAFAIVSGP